MVSLIWQLKQNPVTRAQSPHVNESNQNDNDNDVCNRNTNNNYNCILLMIRIIRIIEIIIPNI